MPEPYKPSDAQFAGVSHLCERDGPLRHFRRLEAPGLSILQQLHFRYELGFVPENLDGKRHKLIVKLADVVKNHHKHVRLRYRAGYVPTVLQTR